MSLMDIKPPAPINMRGTLLGIKQGVFYNQKNNRDLGLFKNFN